MNLVAGFCDYTKSSIGSAGTLATGLLKHMGLSNDLVLHMGLAIGLFLHMDLDLAFFYAWALTLIWASTSHLAFCYIWALNRLRRRQADLFSRSSPVTTRHQAPSQREQRRKEEERRT